MKKNYAELLQRVESQASYYEYHYHGCGQCVLFALQKEFKLPGGIPVFKAAGFTGAGVARTGNMCGALIASIMAMGLVAGREAFGSPMFSEPPKTETGLPRPLIIVRNFYDNFIREFGSWVCRDIQAKFMGRSYDLADPSEYGQFINDGGYDSCSKVVGKCAKMAAETIIEMQNL